MDQPTWLATAWGEYGVEEAVGASSTRAIVQYFADAGHADITDDATPWCAAFVGAILKRCGVSPSGSLMARSYLRWGETLAEPRLGAITVLTRGKSSSAGHVGFFLASTKDRIFLLGGNQGNAVSVDGYSRSRVLGYRWPKPSVAEDKPEKSAAAEADEAPDQSNDFAVALKHVLQMEGGYSNDPHDPGGPTNKGVTLEVFAAWRGEAVASGNRNRLIAALKAIDDQTVTQIFFRRYWQRATCGKLPAALAIMHFDAAVNHGVGSATKFLQTALAVRVDGEVGPQTLAAAHALPVGQVVKRYAEIRRARYRALGHFWRFGKGWLRRVDATEVASLRLAGSTARQAISTAKGTDAMTTDFKFPLPGEIPGQPMAGQPDASADAKWWGHSKTVWGALITTLATVLPVVGPIFGLRLPADVIMQLGDQTLLVVQAIAGLFGTILTLYGRSNASLPLVRRDVNVRL